MQTNQNLMDQMKKIKRVAKPNLILYIGDALAGNDAIEQAKQFHEAVGLDGIVLTKIDADAKGGAALSMAKTIGKPVVFVNLGQTYKDIRRFDAKWMVDRLPRRPSVSFRELLEKGQIAEFPALQLALGAIKGRVDRLTVASIGTGGSKEEYPLGEIQGTAT